MLTQERLKQLLSYDPEMGVFTWNISKGSRAQAAVAAKHLRDKLFTHHHTSHSA